MPNDEQDPVHDEQESVQDDERATDDFDERTAAVERLPLTDRADAFSALHDELRTRLESGGSRSA
ncbi:hypothetical protein [Curtobacterium pusillum]|uniref:Uncharacterized protein n=1 Tax=Curtobacterium pusillum TaxID=69373 RepID=A0AAW3T7Y1_9MICO|nr:hypothetical protein [Curtobacterium pusillum]MBA8990728.1 hypothetical protein [Curtobacterium pusillum]NUU13267.1 hypothetical protein [Curtobacterium pusillum]